MTDVDWDGIREFSVVAILGTMNTGGGLSTSRFMTQTVREQY